MVHPNDFPSVEEVEHGSDHEHEDRVENIDVDFACHQRSVAACDILGHSEHRSNHNQDACSVQDPDKGSPSKCGRVAGAGGRSVDSVMEEADDDDEDPEKGNLNGEAVDDDVLAEINITQRLGAGKYCATCKSQLRSNALQNV